VLDHLTRWAEMWDDWKPEPERFVDAGGDWVILVFRETGRSDSGLQMNERHAELYAVRDGRGRVPEGILRSRRSIRSRRRVGVATLALR
jgi:ketosteroid isomerase-like protein